MHGRTGMKKAEVKAEVRERCEKLLPSARNWQREKAWKRMQTNWNRNWDLFPGFAISQRNMPQLMIMKQSIKN